MSSSLAEAKQALESLVVRGARALPTERASVGVAAVDALLGGGLPRRRLTELVGRRSSGRTSLALAALAAATARDEAAALVDLAGVLDIGAAERAGIDLERLLWVRPGAAKDSASGVLRKALKAVDIVMDVGGFGLVVLDLGEGPARVADAAWLRLGRAAERSSSPGTSVLVVGATRAAGSFAALTLEAVRGRPRWDGGGRSPSVLRGIAAELAVVRSKLGTPAGETRVEWKLR